VATFLISVAIMLTVVGGLVAWMVGVERRRRAVDAVDHDERANMGRRAPAERRIHAGNHR